MENYMSTMRRVTRGAESIISEATWTRGTAGLSPSAVVSSVGVTGSTLDSYKTARSFLTVVPATTTSAGAEIRAKPAPFRPRYTLGPF